MKNNNNNNTVLVTGGHPAPAIAIVDYIVKNKKTIKVCFVGRKYSNFFDKSISFEYKELMGKVDFINLETGRFVNKNLIEIIFQTALFLFGLSKSFFIILKYKPKVVLSFGGYIAIPIAFCAYVFRIPIVTHEQTITPGLANRILGLMATKVLTSFLETDKFFNCKKTVHTGNPYRIELSTKPFKYTFFSTDNKFKKIYITGGSLGSHAINVHIENILLKLLASYEVVHQCGNVYEYNDFQRLSEFRNKLPYDLKKRYFVKSHFTTNEVFYLYKNADLIISRSGANTFFELIQFQKPSVLIPLPSSAFNEQYNQALILKEYGCAEIFLQNNLSNKLLELINAIFRNSTKYQNFKALTKKYGQNGNEAILAQVSKFI